MTDHHQTKQAVTKTAERASGLLDEAKERLSKFADYSIEQGEELIDKAKDRTAELWEDAQDQGKDTWKDVQTLIRKNPTASVGCALVVGAVLYALWSRKENS